MDGQRLLLLVSAMLLASFAYSTSKGKPPKIIAKSEKREIAYRQNESVTLPCQADGDPMPTYYWTKNDKVVDTTGGHYAMQSGNLLIRHTTHGDDGEYKCFARNEHGIAFGLTMRLQAAEIIAFSPGDLTVDRPLVGDYFKIPCTPPQSYPKSVPYFGYNPPLESNKLQHIENNNRVMLDYNGSLHFANVLLNDSLASIGADINYLCVLYNPNLGTYVQGGDHKVNPQVTTGSTTPRGPMLRWPGYSKVTAVKTMTQSLKCIFSGLPTPVVTWHAVDLLGRTIDRFKVTQSGYGTEIELTNVDVSDEGHYTCTAENPQTHTRANHTIQLEVESPPYWARNLLDRYVDEEDNVEIDCEAHGRPNPNILWFINSEPVTEQNFTGRKSLIGQKLKYRSVTVNDSQVIQCLASNQHGAILENIVLKVNAEGPSFMETPKDKKVVAGTTVQFECNTRGAPKPTIDWFRGNPPIKVSGSRYYIQDNGRRLEIKNTEVEDSNTYRCQASNKHGSNSATVVLTVRSPTSIASNPVNKVVRATEEVIIPCDVTTDPNESTNLKVEWQRNGKRIDFKTETHMSMDLTDFSLRIKSSKVTDTGEFSCNATNDLDSATSGTSTLRVKDRPDFPYDVTILSCDVTTAEISWTAGNDNNDQITEFTIYYSGNFSRGNKTYHPPGTVAPGSRYSDRVSVHPWSRYTFHVTAINSIGRSDLSKESGQTCNTRSVPPDRNPTGVCGSLSSAQQLVITWDPMPENEHNGEGFHYIVGYKRHKSSDEETRRSVDDSRQKSISIHGQKEPFAPFEIYVRAANRLGPAPMPEKQLVRSGEGKPQVAAQNFNLVEGSVNGSSAQFFWDPVDTSEEAVRGFFRGYRIVFWKSAEPNIRRSEDILINRPFELCEPLPSEGLTVPPAFRRRRHHHNHHRRVRSTDQVFGSTSQLWPLSDISAAVQVLNQANAGPDSNVIEFRTPAGAPGKVSNLRVVGRGWSHLVVEWQLPLEFAGDIVGYNLDYSVAPPAVGSSSRVLISNPNQKKYKIRRLDYSTRYRILVTAVTVAGVGEEEAVIGETLSLNNPDAPKIVDISTFDNSANVSWLHSDQQPPLNPGSDFFVKFKGPDNSTVVKVFNPDPDSDDNWANVTGLEKGKYEVWVTAKSGIGEMERETDSRLWTVFIGLKNNTVIKPETGELLISHHASAGWFIILMCIIALLLLVLLIVCILRRTHGDMYPVYEKEKMWRHYPLAPDETPFGEYTPSSDNPHLGKSQGSLDSDEKPMESDSDSLEEYEDQDASKFNEDGSFIGQYTGKRKQDSTKPSSINTSV